MLNHFHSRLRQQLQALLKPQKRTFALCVALSILSLALQLASPLLLLQVIEHALPSQETFAPALITLGLLYALLALARATQHRSCQDLGLRVLKDLRETMFQHILDLPNSQRRRLSKGEFISRVFADTEAVHAFISTGFIELFLDLSLVFGMILFLVILDWRLALILAPGLMVLGFGFETLRVRVGSLFKDFLVKRSASLSFANERLSASQTVSNLGVQDLTRSRYSTLAREETQKNLQIMAWSAGGSTLVQGHFAFSLFLLICGALHFGLSPARLLAFIQGVYLLHRPIDGLSSRIALFAKSAASLDRIFSFLKDETAQLGAQVAATLPPLKKKIEIIDLQFGYGSDEKVLKGLSFSIDRGEKIGLVGLSGAGKSTLISLIQGLEQAEEGKILWDQWDLTGVCAQSRAERISYLPQLSRDLQQLLGPDASSERELIEFMTKRGSDLIILDEPTMGRSELAPIFRGSQSCLIVSHKLSSLIDCDRILVLEEGVMTAEGRFGDLLISSPLFRNLYRLQCGSLSSSEKITGVL